MLHESALLGSAYIHEQLVLSREALQQMASTHQQQAWPKEAAMQAPDAVPQSKPAGSGTM